MTETTDSNTMNDSPAEAGGSVVADESREEGIKIEACWPNAALARASVAVVGPSVVPVAHAAALDWSIATVAAALREKLGRPLSLVGTSDVAAANQSDHSFGVVIQLKDQGISALISVDSVALRSLINPLTSDLAGVIATSPPGPVAEATGTERGIAEYLSLLSVDQVLKHANLNGDGPIIESFLNGVQVEQWLGKHQVRSVPLTLNASGLQGFIRVYIAGWSDDQWSAVFAIASQLGETSAKSELLDVHLALPAMQMQPEEFSALSVGDVVLLGVSELSALAHRCELVSSTHWKIADASIVEDSPTYVEAALMPCTPVVCKAALDTTLIRPLLGESKIPVRECSNLSSLQLSKHALSPVTLLVGPSPIARGEMVILGRELAIRIVQMIAD